MTGASIVSAHTWGGMATKTKEGGNHSCDVFIPGRQNYEECAVLFLLDIMTCIILLITIYFSSLETLKTYMHACVQMLIFIHHVSAVP